MRELDKVLGEDEKVVWEGTPNFWPFFLGGSIPLTIFGIFWMGFMTVFTIGWIATTPGVMKFAVFLFPHFWIGLLLLFGPFIYNYLAYSRTHYAITDKRVIFQTGIIGRDFKILDHDQITNAEVNVGIADKLFGNNTGSILFSSANIMADIAHYRSGNIVPAHTFCNISDPYNVFKFVKKVSHDVKTDISYPNKLRPSTNPGYKSKYHPKK